VVKANSSAVVKSTSQPSVNSNQFIGNLLQTLTGHSSWVNSLAYSPDGQTLASGSYDNTIKLWNARTGELLQTFTGHSYSVHSLAYSPDGQTLASGSWDKTIKLWNARTGNLLQTLGHSYSVNSLAYSPDGQTLASGSGTIKIWRLK
ncbi:MAG: WD40 repeat domain-containing protein, partial [Dolichospermum sp.]